MNDADGLHFTMIAQQIIWVNAEIADLQLICIRRGHEITQSSGFDTFRRSIKEARRELDELIAILDEVNTSFR